MRAFNFCAGPAALPTEVLQRAASELADYQNTGISIMEMSHRGRLFQAVLASAKKNLRQLMAIPDDYDILFMQGGATSQFSLVPMNLLSGAGQAAYITTGMWSKKALSHASKLGNVVEYASTLDTQFTSVPSPEEALVNGQYDYLHYTPNETIGGVRFPYTPETNVPLVADFSSSILSEPIDVSKFGLIYAGAQKNIGPAGLVVVIVKRDLLQRSPTELADVWSYRSVSDANSMVNTPPTYSIYLANLVFEWLLEQGGVAAMAAINQRKAAALYHAIDSSSFYSNPVTLPARSLMNIPFTLADAALNDVFLAEAESAGLHSLAGHRSVGGMRASIYNAVPESAVTALVDFMAQFERRYG